MSKHTPGPWDFGWEIQPNGCPTVGHKGLMVCMVAHSAKDPDQKETALANASLISAAPDLLEALEAAIECGMVPSSTAKDGGATRHARQVVVADMIRDAVAKAKGESA